MPCLITEDERNANIKARVWEYITVISRLNVAGRLCVQLYLKKTILSSIIWTLIIYLKNMDQIDVFRLVGPQLV